MSGFKNIVVVELFLVQSCWLSSVYCILKQVESVVANSQAGSLVSLLFTICNYIQIFNSCNELVFYDLLCWNYYFSLTVINSDAFFKQLFLPHVVIFSISS